MSSGRGLPLLSGPPPQPASGTSESSCRKCDKEFNILFTRAKRCYHCGYSYCSTCTDFQALMPRSGADTGYDVMPVCAFCIENLTITAGGKGQLKMQPLARLKKYANAYNLRIEGVLEKDELIDILIAARRPNGCLPPANEEYYRRHSIPNRTSGRSRGLFSRAMDAVGSDRQSSDRHSQTQGGPPPQRAAPYQPRTRRNSGPSTFARPDLDPQQQQGAGSSHAHARFAAPPHPPRAQYPPYPAHSAAHARSADPHLGVPASSAYRPRAASASSPATPRHTSPPPPPPRVPSPHVPSLDELLEMTEARVGALSIGQLKAVLLQNHVNVRLVVEKGDLVNKVRTLVDEERAERERKAREEEAERAAEMGWDHVESEAEAGGRPGSPDVVAMEEEVAEEQPSDEMDVNGMPGDSHDGPAAPAPSRLSPKAQAMASHLERTGLCVVCQDEEANIAIVDCGHLAMCRVCSELVMSSTRECPLCRTRIVTDARLLRIYRT